MTMFPEDVLGLSKSLIEACKAHSLMLVTAESCTGGLIAASITAVSGSSEIFDRGFTTYSYDSKSEMLGVNMDDIIASGAVSETVARQMAEGALAHANAQLSVAVTGIAGPGGGSNEKPVGTVDIAAAREGRETVYLRRLFEGDRDAVRMQTVKAALVMMLGLVE
ncbi:MAG: CinA family protein [Rhodospirillaceae bacterium]